MQQQLDGYDYASTRIWKIHKRTHSDSRRASKEK